MNVLLVTPYFFPSLYYGGPVRVTYEIARRLVNCGHSVSVVTTDVFDKTSRYDKRAESIDGVTVHYFKNISNHLACRYHAFLPLGLYSFLRDETSKYDVIHIHEYFTLLAVLAAKFGRKDHVPILLSAHGSMPVDGARGNEGRKSIFNRLFRGTIAESVSIAIALNGEEKGHYVRAGIPDNRIEIIPNGIDSSEFQQMPSCMEFRERYNIKKEESIILFVGRIHQIKGLDLLMKSFGDVARKLPRWKLVLVGPDDGAMQTLQSIALESGISSKILFTGLLSGREKLAAYAAADIFVLPSRSEGFPVTVLEACASGLPVIVSKACHFPEVQARGAGFEVDLNEHSLSAAIEKLADPESRVSMGTRAKQMVMDNYDWGSIVTRIESAYQKAIKST